MEKGIEYKFIFYIYYMIPLNFKKIPCYSTTDFFQLLDTDSMLISVACGPQCLFESVVYWALKQL